MIGGFLAPGGTPPQSGVGSGGGADAVRGEASELEAAARPWLRCDPLAAVSPGPQVGVGAASAGRARASAADGCQIVWESDGEESNPEKT